MSDLISRSSVLEVLCNGCNSRNNTPVPRCGDMCSDFKAVLKLPAVDAVPVVRCEECVCCSRWNDQLVCSRISGVMDGYYHGTVDVVKPDDYCSYGMRKRAKPLDAKMGSE